MAWHAFYKPLIFNELDVFLCSQNCIALNADSGEVTALTRKLYSAREIAAMHLPGLPATRDNVHIRAEREGWYSEERKGLGGTRRVYEVPARYLSKSPAESAATVDTGLLDAQLEGMQKQMVEMGSTTQLDDMELLEAVIRGVERWVARNDLPPDPNKKAALVTLLYSYFKGVGQLDQGKLEELLKAVA